MPRRALVPWLVMSAVGLGCSGDDPQLTATEYEQLAATPAQFLTLPKHPRQQEDEGPADGIVEFEGNRFIWRAPLSDGLPPPLQNEAHAPGAPVAKAAPGGPLVASGSNVNVSNAVGSYEGETAGASNGAVIVGGSNHLFPGACSSNNCAVSSYTSSDAGATWFTTVMTRTWSGNTFGITFDPGLDVDTAGNFYYVFGGAPLSGNFPNSIAVAKSGPDGLSWGTPAAVTFNARRFFDDKYYIAVDRSGMAFNNRVYVSWDRNVSNNQILYLSFSSNGGTSWAAPIKVDDGTSKFERVIGAYPAVDQASGVVYDSWHNYAKDIIFVDRSTNGGVSWGTDVAAAVTHTGFGQDIGCVGGRSQGPAHAIKVGTNGVIHLVYADSISGKGFDVLYTRSTNGGAGWSAPVALNDDTTAGHQFHPTLAVSGSTVTVSFYDRRDDPANCLSHVYATRSTDGGLTWSANLRLTTDPSNFDGNANGPGDYSSATDHLGQTFPFHSDHRTTDTDTLMEVYAFPF
jgi:hypothetical protein